MAERTNTKSALFVQIFPLNRPKFHIFYVKQNLNISTEKECPLSTADNHSFVHFNAQRRRPSDAREKNERRSEDADCAPSSV